MLGYSELRGRLIMGIIDLIWNRLLGIPVSYLNQWFGLDTQTAWKFHGWRLFFLIAILLVIYEVFIRINDFRRKRTLKNDSIKADADASYLATDDQFQKNLEGAKNLDSTAAKLKKAKEWGKLAEVYASVNKHKEAAKYFGKVKERKRAAMEWAKAGYTLKAARLLQREGDHATAARFYSEKGKPLKAAQTFEKAGNLPESGGAYTDAKRYKDAARIFTDYFSRNPQPGDAMNLAADKCYALIDNEKAQSKVDEDTIKQLRSSVAQCYDTAQRNDLAARLYQESGELEKAGQIYLRMGRLEEAAKCMQQAGNPKAAAEIGGRFYESKGRWKDAAMAYEGAEEFRRAGDCYTKGNDALKASDCYVKAGEFFGAGFALIHAKQPEKAIPLLQKVKENNPNFSQSRQLLGRCFYELGDHDHCVATLENHLTGAKVTSDNINYFWMLALAYEQVGNLDMSLQTLQKIRSVDVSFRDIDQRLSNIQSRISLGPQGSDMRPASGVGNGGAVMSMVEKSLEERYRLDGELGRGGMGVVYKAYDKQLDRPVALKFLGSLVDSSDEYRQRFIREAKAAAKVSHPNIINIFDIGADEGKAYIAMEFIEGPNLNKYLSRKGKLDHREAVNIIGQSCAALDAIHQAGVVHRDIKPDNILIAKGGLIKLMDFGLAKSEDMRMTKSNVVMGTPCYMSPEQALGKDVDVRSDIYSIGLVLHELLTGKIVFADGDVLQRQIKEMPEAPGKTIEGIPTLLDQIIMKAIAKKPEERFQTAKELLGYLRQVGQ